MNRPTHLLLLALTFSTSACGGEGGPASAATRPASASANSAAPPAPVDSALTSDEAQRRFREGLPVVTELSGGEGSREALVRRLVRAVQARDTAAVRAMAITRAEFAHLYYPSTEFTRPPRQMAPQLSWFLILQNSQKGITRLFNRLGNRSLEYLSHRCEGDPVMEGENRLWRQCAVTLRIDGSAETMRLFGSIIERGGRFKFISYANDF